MFSSSEVCRIFSTWKSDALPTIVNISALVSIRALSVGSDSELLLAF